MTPPPPIPIRTRLGDRGLLVSALGTFALKAGNVALTLLVTTLLARALGPNGFGEYTFAFSLVTLASMPAQFGLPTLLTRQVAAYSAAKEWALARGVIQFGWRVSVGVLIFLFLVGAVAGALFLPVITLPRLETIAAGLLVLALVCLTVLRSAALQGLGKVVLGQLPEQAIRPALFACLLVVTASLLHLKPSPRLAMSLHAVAALGALMVALTLYWRESPPELRKTKPLPQVKEWTRAILPLSLLAGVQVISNRADLVLLGWLRGPLDVGYYRIASQGAVLVAFALGAVNVALQPRLARSFKLDNRAELQRLMTWAARVSLAVAVPTTMVLIAWGSKILGAIFGPAFVAAGPCLSILCIGQLINAATGSVGTLLNMTGNERDAMRGFATAAAVSIILNLILIPHFGALGAAISSSIGVAVWNLLLCLSVSRRLGLNPTALGRRSGALLVADGYDK